MPVSQHNGVVLLAHPSGSASAKVHLYGATLTSWTVDGNERVFLSEKAVLDGTKAIRGGIPLVFPVFGKSKAPHVTANLPQHGFARISHWELDNSSDHGETVTAQFVLDHNKIAKEHRDFWPFDFALIYTVKLTAKTIETHLKVHNTGDRPFDFNTLLHTYFLIPDVEKVKVIGLDGYDYVDKVLQQTSKQEGKVIIAGEVDSVYAGVKTSDLQIQFGDGERGIQVYKNGLNDIVVWNPWVVKSKGMADFGDDEYNRMICVEAGQVAEFLTLAAGGSWEGSQILSLL